MKTRKIKVGRREFALLFNYAALADLCDSIEGFGLGDVTESVKSPRTFPITIACLARAGEKEEGRTLDVDADWFAKKMRPSPALIMPIQQAVNQALIDGMTMESEEEDEADEVDVTLEDLKKKEPEESSPSES